MTVDSSRALLLQVFWAEGRYHGAGHWPPAPGRVFQALVAGAGPRQDLPHDVQEALRWLESLPAPVIHAPWATEGQEVQLYVPHNDLDTKGGDPSQIGDIRVGKKVKPWLFEARIPISYLWTFEAHDEFDKQAAKICELARGLYQLGRGVDMASANARILSVAAACELLRILPGERFRPTGQGLAGVDFGATFMLDTPVPGTLASLMARYVANTQRFGLDKSQKKAIPTFTQPPAAQFVSVPYGAGRARVLFELRDLANEGKFAPWRLEYAAGLVRRIRDAAVERLEKALPHDRKDDIDRALVGRPVNGRAIPAEQRVRIVPVPSIGHEHADRDIRRILVDIPADCPVVVEDICWAFAGLSLIHPVTGVEFAMLVAAENTDMLEHYGDGESSRRWRTVTPMVLGERYGLTNPISDETRNAIEEKTGIRITQKENLPIPEKLDTAIADALRHEGVGARPVSVFAQKAPFDKNGERAETFAVKDDHRFSEEKLWHVEVTLDRAVRGPLLLGDGRYFGLGLFAPVSGPEGLLCFQASGFMTYFDLSVMTHSLRRAVMSRCGKQNDGKLDAYVHGHEGSEKAKNTPHLYFQYEPGSHLLWILAPHVVERRQASFDERAQWRKVVRAMETFTQLRAGQAGVLNVRAKIVDDEESILKSAHCWETVTSYTVNRHRDFGDAHAAVKADVKQSLEERGLPEAEIEVLACFRNPEGLGARVRLTFAVAIAGPILLGRTRYMGGGMFRAK